MSISLSDNYAAESLLGAEIRSILYEYVTGRTFGVALPRWRYVCREIDHISNTDQTRVAASHNTRVGQRQMFSRRRKNITVSYAPQQGGKG